MKKGFTLVELLAVIVILGILAMVAIPVVTNVIDSGKIGAIESSVEFYVREVESNFSEWIIEGIPDGVNQVNENGNTVFDVSELNNILELQGTKPISGTIKIDNNYNSDNHYFGYVVNANLEYEDGYIATYTYHTEDNYKGVRAVIDISER